MIKLLVKNRLRGFCSGLLKQGKNASKGKIALFAFLFLYLFAALIQALPMRRLVFNRRRAAFS